MDKKKCLTLIKNWLEEIIIGLNICPFAKEPYINQKIRFSVTQSKPNLNYFQEFLKELQYLNNHPQMDTTLWILPNFLNDLIKFHQLYAICDEFIIKNNQYKVFQTVFFHPLAKIKGIEPDSPKQLVIQAPLPIIHILRTPQIEALGAKIKHDVHETNDKRLSQISAQEYQKIWKNLFQIQ